MYKTLAELTRENKTIDCVCPRCRGLVIVPVVVTEVRQGGTGTIDRYEPMAHCRQCGVGYGWHSKENPTRGLNSIYNGLINVWMSDRQLSAPAPKIVQ
jgi:hypothetical protein